MLECPRPHVLIVDDVPGNLAVLHDALDEAGYAVFVSTDGTSALRRAAQTQPDVILLDALMPVMDGFEVARRLKAEAGLRHIPIIFMTGLTETEHVLAAFEAGGVDYVTKPIRPAEVVARVATHARAARLMKQAQGALDTFGQATLAIHPESGELLWQTQIARKLLAAYVLTDGDATPPVVLDWIRGTAQMRANGFEALPLSISRGEGRLLFILHQRSESNEWLVTLREESDSAVIEALMLAFRITRREAEVLCWVTRGKTNRDIGDILDTSPRTVNKHLERVFDKLCVETRTAAAMLALGKVRVLSE